MSQIFHMQFFKLTGCFSYTQVVIELDLKLPVTVELCMAVLDVSTVTRKICPIEKPFVLQAVCIHRFCGSYMHRKNKKTAPPINHLFYFLKINSVNTTGAL